MAGLTYPPLIGITSEVLWLRYRIKNCCVTLRVALVGRKYLYIIELGQRTAELNPQDHQSAKYDSWLSGARVWIVMRRNANGIIELQGDAATRRSLRPYGGGIYFVPPNDGAGYCVF